MPLEFIGRRALLASAVSGLVVGLPRLLPRRDELVLEAAARLRQFSPDEFGARGDGRTNDQVALMSMAAAISRAGGGAIQFERGKTYLFGAQIRGRNGFFLEGQTPLGFRGVPISIDLNGATLKLVSGLKFGAFDPRSGAADPPQPPSLDRARVAHLGRAIHAENCPLFVVRNGTIDLNSEEQQVGGSWGDSGHQVPCYGVVADNCLDVLWEGVSVMDSCLDGFAYHFDVSDEQAGAGRAIFRNCSARNVARNCVSLTGGRDVTIEHCAFSSAGMAPNAGGTFGSSPKSCFDVEAEGSLIRNIELRDVRLIAGAGSSTAFVADSGDSRGIVLESCTLDGPVWTSRPQTRFERCTIKGVFAKLLGAQAAAADNTQIINCSITDSSSEADLSAYGSLFVSPGSGPGVVVQGSHLEVRSKMLQIGGYRFNDNQVVCQWRGEEHPHGGVIAVAGAKADMRGTTFFDSSSASVAGDILVVTDGTERIDDSIIAGSGGRIKITRA